MKKSMMLLGFAAMILAAGCKKEPKTDPLPPPPPPKEEAKPPPKEAPPEVKAVAKNFERVGFDYDSANITEDGKAALRENAALLQAHAAIRVEIQGHADERGTTDYNLALGQRRAEAVRAYLQAQGVPANRITTVSYGEEKPLSPGEGEVAWAQNRRAEFRVLSGDGVNGTTN